MVVRIAELIMYNESMFDETKQLSEVRDKLNEILEKDESDSLRLKEIVEFINKEKKKHESAIKYNTSDSIVVKAMNLPLARELTQVKTVYLRHNLEVLNKIVRS